LEDAKTNAAKMAKQRDEANADPRREAIPIELGSLQSKIDNIKNKIDTEKAIEKDLRELQEHEFQIQNSKKQADSDLDQLQEDIKQDSCSYNFTTYKVEAPPAELPNRRDDSKGEQLKKSMERICDDVQERLIERDSEFNDENDTVRRLTAAVSERNALLQQSQQSVAITKNRMTQLEESVEKVKKVIQEVRSFEDRIPASLDQGNPHDLFDYLTKRLEDLEGESTEGIPHDAIKKVLKKLFKLVRPLRINIAFHLFCVATWKFLTYI
jgi:chromosome segregation ATPase